MNATSAEAIPQLISYIAPAAPATRRPADGDEPFLRPEIGFTPAWYRQHLDIDFGEAFHADPAYRREAVIAMRDLLRSRFPGTQIGRADSPDEPLDLLTGVFSACSVAAIYGVPIIYAADNWPNCEHEYLTDVPVQRLLPATISRAVSHDIPDSSARVVDSLAGQLWRYRHERLTCSQPES